MKSWIKKIGQNRFQFFFFVGILALLFIALILSATADPIDNTPIEEPNDKQPIDHEEDPVPEVLKHPFDNVSDFIVVRKFYERDASQSDQEKALIKYGTSYRISVGTSFARIDNQPFDVKSAFSGTVIEVRESPLYGNYCIIEHTDNIKTHYYGLSEVTVKAGDTVKQGDKIGVSGTTEIDQEAGNHVYFKVVRGSKNINPEKVFGKTTAQI
ncbi:MAG TPA: M23 family metallopeptidase [Bacilli bacterium]|nr:M23 family metallopeptidase [Bacilli bacterium]